MKSKIKKIFIGLGGIKVLRAINKTPRVLFYHSVDNIVNQEVEYVAFSIENFKRQINYLRKHYEIISMDEFYTRYTTDSFTNREIVLTFDDGYANNLYVVAPILNKYKIPFSVFICTEHIETGEYFPTSIARIIIIGSDLTSISIPFLKISEEDISDINKRRVIYKRVSKEIKSRPLHEVRTIIKELKYNLPKDEYKKLQEKFKSDRPMTWNEVKQLHNMGVTIGSHCKYHFICHSNQENKEVERQIKESKEIIETHIGSPCDYFVYPNGNFTDDSNRFVKKAGYKLGFKTDTGLLNKQKNNIESLPRLGASQNFVNFRILLSLYPSIFTKSK